MPPRFTPDMFLKGVACFASLYVVTRSVCARIATASSSFLAPVTTPGGKPVTDDALFGLIARLPVMAVEPVLVIAEAAITVKLAADSSRGWATAARAPVGNAASVAPRAHARRSAQREAFPTPVRSITESRACAAFPEKTVRQRT